jgi:NADH-quinone oxidoreductase subunit M
MSASFLRIDGKLSFFMLYTVPWLSILITLPTLGAGMIMSIRKQDKGSALNVRYVGLLSSFVSLCISLYLFTQFNPKVLGWQFIEDIPLFIPGFHYFLGIDGLSLIFILLTALLTFLVMLASWRSVHDNIREYIALFLFLESLIMGAFCARDLLLFYIFLECLLVAMFFIIGFWGGRRRIPAAFKFFLYTFLGSVPMFLGLVYIYYQVGTFDLRILVNYLFSKPEQNALWLVFFLSFSIKISIWPLHAWLPDAHTQAPTGGSVILAGILLKLGGYGFFQFALPLFPHASIFFAPAILFLGSIAVIYASCVAFAQTDIKRLVAYSSIAHMGFVSIGLFTFTVESLQGAMFQMVSHGLTSAGLFLAVGIAYDRFHTRDINAFGGMVQILPRYALWTMILILGSIGLPGTSGFVGEFLIAVGAFRSYPIIISCAVLGTVLGAVYGLRFYHKLFFGCYQQDSKEPVPPLSVQENGMLMTLSLCIVFFGIYPDALLRVTRVPVTRVLLCIQQKAPELFVEKQGRHLSMWLRKRDRP